MGVASLTAYADRATPEEVTVSDLELFADYARSLLELSGARSYLSVLFTTNVSYLNPSKAEPERRKEAQRILRSFEREGAANAAPCLFCGRSAIETVYRDLAPMLTGRDAVNFFPYGQRGIDVCGRCLLSLQALVVGAPFISGRALVVSTDDHELLLGLVRGWVAEARRRYQMEALAEGEPFKASQPKTRLIKALVDTQAEGARSGASGIVAYHLSNSGQGPGIQVFTLPSNVVRFVRLAGQQAYRQTWSAAVARAWRVGARPPKPGEDDLARNGKLRNALYEDLFSLPDEAARFVYRHLLGLARTFVLERGEVGATAPSPAIAPWSLTQLFLTEVVGMDKSRVDAIRQLGDNLANDIASTNDRRLFDRAYRARSMYEVRRLLIGDDLSRIQRQESPLITLEGYMTVFEGDGDVGRRDRNLAWDLVLIRMLEQLHQSRWFDKNRDVLETVVQELQQDEDVEE